MAENLDLVTLLARIDRLKVEWEALQPIKPEYQERLWRKLRLEWNFNSNHIEGNTLTYESTEALIFFDKASGNHEMREYEEMKAHDVAIEMVRQWSSDEERALTERDIRDLNQVILVRDFYKDAQTHSGDATRRKIEVGNYKKLPNSVRLQNGEMFHYASVEETPAKMRDLMLWLRENEDLHPIALAAVFHHKFILIHPFDDGNGRVARLLVNYLLMKAGYQPIVIKSADKKGYLDALQRADAGDLEAFVEYIAKQAEWSMDLSIKAAKGEEIAEQGDVEKRLELLKRRMAGVNNEKVVQLKFSSEVYKGILLDWIIPLTLRLHSSFDDFFDLFFEHEFIATFGGVGLNFVSNSRPTILELRDFQDTGLLKPILLNKLFSKVEIGLSLKNLRIAKKQDIEIYPRVTVEFDQISYTLSISNFLSTDPERMEVVFKRLLHEQISEAEQKSLVIDLRKRVIDQIESLSVEKS